MYIYDKICYIGNFWPSVNNYHCIFKKSISILLLHTRLYFTYSFLFFQFGNRYVLPPPNSEFAKQGIKLGDLSIEMKSAYFVLLNGSYEYKFFNCFFFPWCSK